MRIKSARAGGSYSISPRPVAILGASDAAQRALLTSWLVDQRRFGNPCPDVAVEVVESTKGLRPRPVHERADRILRFLVEKTAILGERVTYTIVDYLAGHQNLTPEEEVYCELLAHSESLGAGDFCFLIQYLIDGGFLLHEGRNNNSQSCVVTVRGYARLEELEKGHAASLTAFVAMWFDESMNDVWWLGVRPAIEAAGYRPLRIDQEEHIDKIDDRIIGEIRRCRFVVADFTQGMSGARGGVYYEAGFAQGLDLPVIFTCREDSLCKVHFDTRQYNHLVWEDPEDLRERLEKRICAVIGDGPLRGENGEA